MQNPATRTLRRILLFVHVRHFYPTNKNLIRNYQITTSLSLSLMGTCNYTVDGGRRLLLTRLRPEPVLVPALGVY